MSAKDGGPAFPVDDFRAVHEAASAAVEGIASVDERDKVYIKTAARMLHGMTLRDYFAAKAMQGLFGGPAMSVLSTVAEKHDMNEMTLAAESSYVMADAMLRARVK